MRYSETIKIMRYLSIDDKLDKFELSLSKSSYMGYIYLDILLNLFYWAMIRFKNYICNTKILLLSDVSQWRTWTILRVADFGFFWRALTSWVSLISSFTRSASLATVHRISTTCYWTATPFSPFCPLWTNFRFLINWS